MQSVDVSKLVLPGFPDWCPICGMDAPGDQITVRTLAWDATAPVLRSFGPLCWLRIPGCDACDRRIRRINYGRRMSYLGCQAAALWFMGDMLGWDTSSTNKVLWYLVAAIFLVPWIWWESRYPQPIELTILNDGFRFRFENHDYAAEFADLNGVDVRSEATPVR